MTTIKFIKTTILLIALTVFAACGGKKEEVATEAHIESATTVELTDEQMKTIKLETGVMELRELSSVLKVNGKIDVPPQSLVSINTPFGGFLKSTTLLQGSTVNKGQVIAVIENPEYIQMQQDYIEAHAQLEFAKSDYERQQELAKENVNAQKTLQQSKTNYNVLFGKVSGLKEKLRLLNISTDAVEQGKIQSSITINAPISGYVTKVNSNVGAYVSPQDVLFQIANTEQMHAELTVFEKDIPKLKEGQKVRFTLSNDTKEHMASIELIGREVSEDRTVQVHCLLGAEDKEVLPGTYFSAVIETGGAKVSSVPDEAVVAFEGKSYVFIFKKNEKLKDGEEKAVFDMVEVGAGISENGYTEIISKEINAGTKIVIKGTYSLLSKLKNSEEEE